MPWPTVGLVTDEISAYGRSGPTDPTLKRVRTRHFRRAKEAGTKITGLTSYDCLSAAIFDQAGIDFLLVGDSAGNAVFGYDTTLPVTIDELLPLTSAVVRATRRALVVADLPFGSYESGPDEALHTAIRFMKLTGCHAVKLEGGARSAKQIRRIVRAGIPVMAHIGFTPQSEHGLGGHIIQGRGRDGEADLIEDAKAVEDAGKKLEFLPGFDIVIGQAPVDNTIPIEENRLISHSGIWLDFAEQFGFDHLTKNVANSNMRLLDSRSVSGGYTNTMFRNIADPASSFSGHSNRDHPKAFCCFKAGEYIA